MLSIFVDGDACPVKEEVVRVASRYAIEVYMVSNRGLRAAVGPNLHPIVVGDGFDEADNWIVDHVAAGDIVITADIRLAARAIDKGANALAHDGRGFTQANIGSVLAMRDLNAYLREAGEITTHNPSFSKKNRSQFLQSLDNLVQRLKR